MRRRASNCLSRKDKIGGFLHLIGEDDELSCEGGKIWEDQTVAGFTHRVATDADDDGNRGTLSISDVPGVYSFTYDYTPRQQLKQINRGGSSYVEFSYDPNGNLTRRQNMAQGQARDATKLQYDDLNRVTICEQTGYNDENFARSNYNDYDAVNNLKSISREEDSNKGEIFTYDAANQLSSVSYKADVEWHTPGGAPGGMIDEVEEDGEKETLAALAADPEREPLAKEGGVIESVSGPRTVTYTNDAINRLSMDDPNIGTPTNYDRNPLNQYTSVTGHGALNYDGNLNVSGYDGWAFVHDAEKRLLSVTGNGHSAQFAYDGLGRCVKRTIDGATTVFTYDGWKPVAEWTGAGAIVAWNLYGTGADEILVRFQQTPEGYLHYHLDAMGNVQFLLSDRPEPGLEKYTYDVFGKPRIVGWNGDVRPISNHGNRFLFTGREYLYTFGLYDYRHRIYHPGLGRFIETDPLGQQIEGAKLSAEQTALYPEGSAPTMFSSSELNLYRYCHNDPVNLSDPFGLAPIRVEDDVDKKSRDGLTTVRDIMKMSGDGMERAKSTGRDPETGKVFLGEPTEKGKWNPNGKGGQSVEIPEPRTGSGINPESGVHAHPDNNQTDGNGKVRTDGKAGPIASNGDRQWGDSQQRPIYTISGNGKIIERYRPDDSGKRNGGVTERWNGQTWSPLKY